MANNNNNGDRNTTKFHRDGTVTYWSIYRQQWFNRIPATEISDEELSTMTNGERAVWQVAAKRCRPRVHRVGVSCGVFCIDCEREDEWANDGYEG
jgi:hypothetical protein